MKKVLIFQIDEEEIAVTVPSSSTKNVAILVTIIGIVLTDYTSDALQNPSRAYLLDVCRAGEFCSSNSPPKISVNSHQWRGMCYCTRCRETWSQKFKNFYLLTYFLKENNSRAASSTRKKRFRLRNKSFIFGLGRGETEQVLDLSERFGLFITHLAMCSQENPLVFTFTWSV